MATGGQAGDLFHQFARKLVDKKIFGGGGKRIPLPDVPAGEPFQVESDTPQIGLSVQPWTINRSRLAFSAGTLDELVAPELTARGELQISVRKVGDTVWSKLIPGANFSIDIACHDEDGEQYDLIYTSSADQDDGVQFSVKIQAKAREPRTCPCQGDARRLERCLVGQWHLDNEANKAWLLRFSHFPAAEVSGNYDLDFRRPRAAQARFDQFHTKLLMATDTGLQPWIETNHHGTIDYEVVKTRPGKLCMTMKSANGTTRYTVGGTGEDAPLGNLFGEAEDNTEVSYRCEGRTLDIWLEQGARRWVEWHFNKQ